MRAVSSIVTLLLAALPAVSQTTPSQLVFGTGAAPPPTSASTRVVGTTGQQTLYYWVVARYPSGYSSPVGPASAFQTVGAANLSVTNYVAVSWSAMPQATGYDVLRSTTPTFPAPAGCTACAVVLNTPGAAVNDTGAALSAWPAAGTSPAVPSQAVLNLDNTSAAQPFVNVSLLSQKFSQVYKMVLVSGTPTAGNCAQWGSYGLLTDAGAACGTGSGGSSVAAGTGILISTAGSPPTSTVSADSATVEFLSTAQAGTPLYCASASGSATTYTCALNPMLTAYTAGMTLAWKVDTSCTGSTTTTLNIDSLGAKSIKQADGTTDPASGDCPANRQLALRYDGTVFRILGGGAGGGGTAGPGLLDTSGTWSFNPLDPSIIYLVEEFNSGAANTYTNSSGIINFNMQPVVGSGTFTGFAPGSDITAVGGVNLNTAATANSANAISAIVNAQNGNPNPWHVMNSGTWKATYRFKLSQVGNQTFMVGWDNAGAAAPGTASSLYVEGTSASSDTNFFFKNCNSTTCSTRVDSGVAIDTNWHVLTTGRDGTNMYICLDACASPTTISTNVPASVMAPKFYIKTDNSTAMTLTADYFRYLQWGITSY